tara:strand:- start:6801 stop:7583 length:783 start_codon:yes stop_codon:yes gene_type:complete
LSFKKSYSRIFIFCISCFFINITGCSNLQTKEENDLSWSNWGEIITLNSKIQNCITITAPHGTNDLKTDILVKRISQLGSFPSIIATGFVEKDGLTRNRINVNRPSEKFNSGTTKMHFFSKRSELVYKEFLKRVLIIHANPTKNLYVEIHGQSKFPQEIEIATKGISLNDAKIFLKLWEKNKNFTKKSKKLFKNIELRIEPLHSIYYKATDNKDFGVISKVKKVLHIELPKVLRIIPENRILTAKLITKVLIEFKRNTCY